jgi:hypothetical protein
VGKALFFFFLGLFIFEAFLDVNPSRIDVAGTSFSISFYVYITLFDLFHYFWAGLLALAIGSALFAFSKYRYVPIALFLFCAAFYYQIIQAPGLMHFYETTYACHSVLSSQGFFERYACPLMSMINGHPNIPLQGSVLAPISLAISTVSCLAWRVRAGIKIALSETVIFLSGTITAFELSIFQFQQLWFEKQVTDYQRLFYSGEFTNHDLLNISSVVLIAFLGFRIFLWYRSVRKLQLVPIPLVQRLRALSRRQSYS